MISPQRYASTRSVMKRRAETVEYVLNTTAKIASDSGMGCRPVLGMSVRSAAHKSRNKSLNFAFAATCAELYAGQFCAYVGRAPSIELVWEDDTRHLAVSSGESKLRVHCSIDS